MKWKASPFSSSRSCSAGDRASAWVRRIQPEQPANRAVDTPGCSERLPASGCSLRLPAHLWNDGLRRREGVVHGADAVAVANRQACGWWSASQSDHRGRHMAAHECRQAGPTGRGRRPLAVPAAARAHQRRSQHSSSSAAGRAAEQKKKDGQHPLRSAPFISGGKPAVNSRSWLSSGPICSSGRFISTFTAAGRGGRATGREGGWVWAQAT